ncbi:MAG: FG-GAP repeat protein [Ignavibacteria bacterium]|nr:FG-GAP repeat protein [Ignavibacteria bacterium]
MEKRTILRAQHETSEREFIYELQKQYELSPKVRESIAESAKRCLVRDNALKEGQKEVSVISSEERSGRLIEKQQNYHETPCIMLYLNQKSEIPLPGEPIHLRDVNGDGFDEILIGAHNYNNMAGRAYLYCGGFNMIQSLI